MHLRLIRHATLRLEIDGRHLLVDPMLDPAGARPATPSDGDHRRDPLVELPEPAEVVVAGLDAVLVTQLEQDHFDATAAELLRRETPVLCQPQDGEALRDMGFADVRPVESTIEWEGIQITRTPARRAAGRGAEALGPASGFVLRDSAGRVLYLAGDSPSCTTVERVLAEHRPDVVVLHAGGGLRGAEPIVMDADDVVAVARRLSGTRVVAVHLDAIGRGAETRPDLHQRIHEEGLTDRVTVPEDGAAVPVE